MRVKMEETGDYSFIIFCKSSLYSSTDQSTKTTYSVV